MANSGVKNTPSHARAFSWLLLDGIAVCCVFSLLLFFVAQVARYFEHIDWVTLRYSLGRIWNAPKFGYIPQWGKCFRSVHYWRLYLIRYYTLNVIKRCPQSWGYLCEYLIVTCKTHFWGLSIFGRTPQRNFASAEYRCSLLSIALGGGHFDHTHTVWLYESFVVH